jgi:hypothetical protein
MKQAYVVEIDERVVAVRMIEALGNCRAADGQTAAEALDSLERSWAAVHADRPFPFRILARAACDYFIQVCEQAQASEDVLQ